MDKFLRNAWYAAALSDEVDQARIVPRTILGERVALYRTPDGDPVALQDRCPHRFAPLHEGELRDGVVRCSYHGLCFDASGRCVGNPHGNGRIPERARVRSYPLLERHGVVWIWPGRPETADPALVLDLSPAVSLLPHAGFSGYLHTEANYELIIDNLMDLSHADYIHKGSLNTGGALSRIRPRVHSTCDAVEAFWCYEADIAQPVVRAAVPDPDGAVEQSFRMVWRAPANLMLWATVRNLDQPADTTSEAVTAHLLTPESETSSHYFFLLARNWDQESAAVNDAMKAGVSAAFLNEDKPVLQSVQTSMDGADFWALQPLILSCDVGPIHARRALARLIREEDNMSAGHDRQPDADLMDRQLESWT